MELGWKAALVAVMAVLVIVLKVKAKRHGHDRFRELHSRRKYRVPVDAEGRPRLPAGFESEDPQ